MPERKAFLEKIHIKNFLSLRDVTLPFKPLTVLVGPNASGKSNVLGALGVLKTMMVDEQFSPDKFMRNSVWAGKVQKIAFQLKTKVEDHQTLYRLEVKAKPNPSFLTEQLSVNDIEVISIRGGKGVVKDENGENETTYNSNKLALGSAGNYGNKPITRVLTKFIKEWEIYDFDAQSILGSLTDFSLDEKENKEFPKLDRDGSQLPKVLLDWYKNSPERFQNVSDALAASTNRRVDQRLIYRQNKLCLLEGNNYPISLDSASGGILYLIAYYILLNEPELPPLIAIEEPERNLHPGALTEIAHVLEQIAERSQIIITTHSSQLLDAFSPASLSDSLGVLLLQNRPGFGTEAINLEECSDKGEALAGWMADFGIGSAIFDSGLLPDEMEDKPECQA